MHATYYRSHLILTLSKLLGICCFHELPFFAMCFGHFSFQFSWVENGCIRLDIKWRLASTFLLSLSSSFYGTASWWQQIINWAWGSKRFYMKSIVMKGQNNLPNLFIPICKLRWTINFLAYQLKVTKSQKIIIPKNKKFFYC